MSVAAIFVQKNKNINRYSGPGAAGRFPLRPRTRLYEAAAKQALRTGGRGGL
jgi:hypothetical protein